MQSYEAKSRNSRENEVSQVLSFLCSGFAVAALSVKHNGQRESEGLFIVPGLENGTEKCTPLRERVPLARDLQF
jgi:hypothetical protein